MAWSVERAVAGKVFAAQRRDIFGAGPVVGAAIVLHWEGMRHFKPCPVLSDGCAAVTVCGERVAEFGRPADGDGVIGTVAPDPWALNAFGQYSPRIWFGRVRRSG